MGFSGIRIPSRFSGIRQSRVGFADGDFTGDSDSSRCDPNDYDNECGFLQPLKIRSDKVYQFTDDKRDETGQVDVNMKAPGRTYRRNQSDQISNYKVQNVIQRSDLCDTLEAMRMRDNKVFVIKIISKKRLAGRQANLGVSFSVDFFSDALQYVSTIPRSGVLPVVLPRRIFEDPDAVYFVFDYYEEIKSEALSSAEVKQVLLDAERFLSELGYRARDAKSMDLVKQGGRTCVVVDIVEVVKVDDKASRDADENGLNLNHDLPAGRNSVNNQDMARPSISFGDFGLRRYWMDVSNIPYTSTSTSQCKVEACNGRIELYFYGDCQHFAVVATRDNDIRVEIKAGNTTAKSYVLADLPLQHLARYLYARRVVTSIRRHSVCVAVNAGTRRARLYADGRFEDSTIAGMARPGITRDNQKFRAQCERLLNDAL
ncbi:hypothetical protein POJ06DRAFT_247046 [Lipomyces tetrasporus]|uniref:Uncharacterized protein n=1 Tax=Lipomyces tetrasporus TaxID=54092 RepID=A0AAD7QXU9_9ASCO|nr:uncharacterized protein POJ06DRAFT_247046 [Lipomyces tetrasporus]KAJ8103263.1 hypothetical protein POJ06DRAFT_247046 [Lipomyces tetrasporus]